MRLFNSGHVRIAGTGSCTPSRVVTNADLAESVSTTDAWIFDNLGIRERRVAAEDQFTSDLAAGAARNALADAGIAANDVGLIIVATATPDRKAPSTACLVQSKLGITNECPAFDLAAVCSGFIYAMTVASQFLHSNSCRHALIIGADTFSRITDWTRRDCVFFGDGAGAAVLSRVDDGSAFFTAMLHAEGRGHDAFTVYPQDTTFTMNGRAVYDTGSAVIPRAIQTLLEVHDIKPDDIAILVPHQPSIRMLQKAAATIGLPFERVATNMDRYANTSGATIPLLLDEVKRAGRIAPGDIVAFAAVGSGWTWGAALYRWT